jgi:hypothetical protein
MFAELNDKSSLSLYRQVKCEWGKEGYVVSVQGMREKELYGGKQEFGN